MPADFDVDDEMSDAVFRVFEASKAPAIPWTDEKAERYRGQLRDIPVWRGSDEERRVVPEDVRGVCSLLCDEGDVEGEVGHFFRRFDSQGSGVVSLTEFKSRLKYEAGLARLRWVGEWAGGKDAKTGNI